MTGYQCRMLSLSILSISTLARVEQHVVLSGVSDLSSAHMPITSKICYLPLFHLTSETWLLKRIQFY